MWVKLTHIDEANAAPFAKFTSNSGLIICGVIGKRAFAFDSTCPHKGGPLEKGEMIEDRIKCSWHGYKFNVFTGRVASIPYSAKYGKWRETGDLLLHRAKVSNGFLYVETRRLISDTL